MSIRGRFSRPLLLTLALFTAALPFLQPKACAGALREGLALCGGPLLLSLFPFLIVSSLLIQSNVGSVLGFLLRPAVRLLGLRSPCAESVLLVGLVGGFAPAANAVAEGVHRGHLSAKEASALLPACICSGPSFVIVTVGGQMLGSTALGARLFLAQLLAGYLSAALLCRSSGTAGKKERPPKVLPQQPPSLDKTIAAASVTYLKLCGFVLYFRFLAAGFAALLPDEYAFWPAVLLEVSSGCDLASRTGLWASVLCCTALSLQGLSVLLQVRTICPPEVSLRPLLLARVLHLPTSLALFVLTLPLQAREAFSTLQGRTVFMRKVPADCALLVFFACCLLACELCRRAQLAQPSARGKKKGGQ